MQQRKSRYLQRSVCDLCRFFLLIFEGLFSWFCNYFCDVRLRRSKQCALLKTNPLIEEGECSDAKMRDDILTSYCSMLLRHDTMANRGSNLNLTCLHEKKAYILDFQHFQNQKILGFQKPIFQQCAVISGLTPGNYSAVIFSTCLS